MKENIKAQLYLYMQMFPNCCVFYLIGFIEERITRKFYAELRTYSWEKVNILRGDSIGVGEK
jgi:hypothetical protein